LLIWEDKKFNSLDIEPFVIPIIYKNNKRIYTPDALINNKYLIEIKPLAHLKIHPNDKERFSIEVWCANEFCEEKGLKFILLDDKQIDFTTEKFKKYLNDNICLIDKYNIKFINKSPLRKK